jgi:GNAT superfamily N-acetyltransferase
MRVRAVEEQDRAWVARFVAEHWGSPQVVVHGEVYEPATLPGFLALDEAGARIGLLTYTLARGACEVVTLDSLVEGCGVGTALLESVHELARGEGISRVWLVTTNDNLHALGFYQRRGYTLVAVHADAVAASRARKPQIPLIGENRIPIRDEIELEYRIEHAPGNPGPPLA